MEKSVRMFHSTEFDGIPTVAQYFWLARAYLDGSRLLCEALIQEDYSPQYSSSRVILHLCRHSVELFLKGAIAVATRTTPPRTHNLAHLFTEYQRRYPSSDYFFEVPFGIEVLDTYDFFPELLDPNQTLNERYYHNTLDQRYKYPTDSNGRPFNSPEGFIPQMFLSEIVALWETFIKLEIRIAKISEKDESSM